MKHFNLSTAIRQATIILSTWAGYLYTRSGLLLALAIIATVLSAVWLLLELQRITPDHPNDDGERM